MYDQVKNELVGCLGQIRQMLGLSSAPKAVKKSLPYLMRASFLSPAEIDFYHALQPAAGDGVVIQVKVSLSDLFYPKTGDRSENARYHAKIAQRKIDFLLCDRRTIEPLLGIELDDRSPSRQRPESDHFVEQVFAVARLPLHRMSVQTDYDIPMLGVMLRTLAEIPEPEEEPAEGSVELEPVDIESSHPQADAWSPDSPSCPQCGRPMVLRTVTKEGPHQGRQFWGCFAFPNCRGVLEYLPPPGA